MIPLAYNLRNLAVRKTTTAAAAGGLGLVVFVFASVMMLAKGLEAACSRASDPNTVILLRRGANGEMDSWIDEENVPVIAATPGIARAGNGQPVVAAELVVLILLGDGSGGLSNVTLRGVPDDVRILRPTVHMIQGRPARPGTDEAVIGKGLLAKGLNVGGTIEMRPNHPLSIVGVFEDQGSAFESEVWGDPSVIRATYGREGIVSSVRVRVASTQAFDAFKETVERNQQLNVNAMRDSEFFANASRGSTVFVSALGFLMAAFVSIGAIIGAMITMHSTVARRQREIGTLRALGFSRTQILLSFLAESVVLALIGGILGTAASTLMLLKRITVINFGTWSDVTFNTQLTPGIVVGAMTVAGVMGVIGGFIPAIRAARVTPIEAMRSR